MEDLRAQGFGLAAVSYDSQETLAAFSTQNGITFPVLSDVGSATIERFGILNTVALEYLENDSDDPEFIAYVRQFATVGGRQERVRGIPFPGTFMVDREGRVTSRYFEDYYRERSTVSNIMLRLGAGEDTVTGTQIESDHLDITTYPSDGTVALGNRFALVVDITPGPGMHVYAPGASDYRVISLTVEPQPFLSVLPIDFPPSEIYYFAPLNERVPVYQKPFRLLQEVVPAVTPEAQKAFAGKDNLTIVGTLEYQACDDAICYNPVTVPLTWTVALRPFLRPEPRQ